MALTKFTENDEDLSTDRGFQFKFSPDADSGSARSIAGITSATCAIAAPDESEELAAAQAQVTRDQVWQRAQKPDLARDVDVTTPAAVFRPQCGAKGKFCNQCSARLAANLKCRGCGGELEPGSRFCAESGTSSRCIDRRRPTSRQTPDTQAARGLPGCP